MQAIRLSRFATFHPWYFPLHVELLPKHLLDQIFVSLQIGEVSRSICLEGQISKWSIVKMIEQPSLARGSMVLLT